MERMEMMKKFYVQAQKTTAAMAVSVLIYGAIGYYLIRSGRGGPAILSPQIYPIAKYGALAISLAGIFLVWQLNIRMFSRLQASLADLQAGAPNAMEALTRAVQKLTTGTVVMSAGAEVPVLLGMVLVFLGRQPLDYIPFAVISLVGFFLAFPKKHQWSSWLNTDL
jgi:hypothetical protein